MADDLQAWPKASFMALEDSMFPYTEIDLERIAAEPSKVVDLQWKVAIKQLPREGRHTEFSTGETVPLEPTPTEHWLMEAQNTYQERKASKRIDCVTFCDGSTDAVFVRKRLDIKFPSEKEAILGQIRDYNARLSQHANIARIVASYARGQTVSFLTLRAETNLSTFLEVFTGASEADTLLGWILDLASAVKYIHDRHMQHRSIRPQKILVDSHTRRLRLSVFGIASPARPTGALLFPSYSEDPAYIYAAPETVGRREQTPAADVFSLGCVFLEMATTARGREVEDLKEYRSATSHDNSYHQNLGRIDAWIEILRASRVRRERLNRGGGPSGATDIMMTAGGVPNVLNVVQGMVSADPAARLSMKRVLSHLEGKSGSGSNLPSSSGKPDEATPRSIRARRRSLDLSMELARAPALGASTMRQDGIWGELQSLDGYYNNSSRDQPPPRPQPPTSSSARNSFDKESRPKDMSIFDEIWH
jgi:serine/threonine protein kinase